MRKRVFGVEPCPMCGTPGAQVTYSEVVTGSDTVSNARAIMRAACANLQCPYFDPTMVEEP